ncbi:RHS repeat-associated core domain-containing protein [Vibrio parahaemolyticus]|nr:RHS repeat protein [Vibrio parahaemolyticus]EME0129366.1 RHS repeat protein [Vibrio parahaemolyticus]
MNTSLFSNTPSVTVLDNRGLSVRYIAYYRHPNEPTTTQTRITHHQYDTRGTLKQSADPRLHLSGQANFHYLTDLTGHVLRTQGVDNGTSVSLSDAAGRVFIAVSNISTAADGSEDKSQAVTRTWQYEEASLPGRPLSITEQVTGETARITERFVYASNTEAEKAQNLAGQCISYYDTAGLVQTGSIALTGVALSAIRRLLKDADNPDVVADWQGGGASVWNEQLSNENYVTLTTTDATGTVLTTTDTKGNVQRVAYDVSGLMSGSWLTLKEGTEQVIVGSVTYSAAGQKLREEQGNGVVTTYSYERETQRLIGIKTERPTGHALGAKVLQDLRYEYDPVGNVVKIHNDAEETRFWRNQKVVPENTYTYDSLYQLVSATGREMANAIQQNSHLPSTIIPLSSDSSAYTNYTRTYTYDEVGNLTQVKHSAPATSNNYTTTMTVSDSSNRSIQSTLTENASDVDGFFTVGGQQNQLQPGQRLIWTPRNELLKVTPVVRDGDIDDVESYRYDAGSQRLLKVSKQKAASSVQTLRALYLPGIELRSVAQDNTETESLQVITIGEVGRAQVRVLHWEKGGPSEISNDQVRYSYDGLIGSCNLEVDSSGHVISMEEYYPYGGTAILTARNQVEVKYKTVRYSGKERDATGLYYYGYRYYQPWVGRWLSSDPAGTVDGLNLYRMVRNNPVTLKDSDGRKPRKPKMSSKEFRGLLPKVDFQYERGEYSLTRSVSTPNLSAVHDIGEHPPLKFLGFHGTNEKSAKNILSHKLDIDLIPHGQIGQGFYLAKDRALAEGSADPSGGKRKKEYDEKIPFINKVKNVLWNSLGMDSYVYKPDYPEEITPAMLKVYEKVPVVHSQWNSMMNGDLAVIRYSDDQQAAADEMINKMSQNLQMVIPSSEMDKLVLERDDGIEATGQWNDYRESHVPEASYFSLEHPDAAVDAQMVDIYSQVRRKFQRERRS